jgi:peptide chain release factor 2
MYLRWAERQGYSVELDEATDGGEAGISSATFIVKGRYAFGRLQAERGVHRLVRISPFDSQSRRHTAFAALSVVPLFDRVADEVQIDEKDLRIDTYRSSGAGGQHVNVTDSAVQILAARLADLARREREAEMQSLAGEQRDVAWGSQIRSYVLHPYQQVKDLRSGHETSNVDAVLDGDLGDLIESYLRWAREQQTAA